MSDGIKFMIDLDSRTQGAAMADSALGRVENTAERTNRALGDAGGKVSAFSSDLFKATVAAHYFEKATDWAIDKVKSGFEAVKETIRETINEAAGEKREKMAMTNLLGGPAAAEQALHYLDRFSELSEFGEKHTKTFGIELMNAGYKGQRWKDALAAIADAASMAPDKIAGAQDALASFTRMEKTGRLDARILSGLQLNVKDVMKDLGHALGMTPESVKKALNEGAVPAAKAYEIVLRALERKTGKALGEAGLKAGTGLDAKLTHLRELPEKIMKSVSDGPGMNKIETYFDRLLTAFDPSGPDGAKMVKGLDSLMDSVGSFLKETDWKSVGMSIGGIASNLGKWIDPLSKIAGFMLKVTEGLAALPKVGEVIGDYFAEKNMPEARKPATKENPRGFVVAAGGMGGMAVSLEPPMSEYEKKQTEFDRKNEAAFAGIPAFPKRGVMEPIEDVGPVPVPLRLPEFPKGGAGGGGSAGSTHIEGKAEVHVHLPGGSAASPQEVAHAAKTGTEAGLTTALEQQALQQGTRSARRKKN